MRAKMGVGVLYLGVLGLLTGCSGVIGTPLYTVPEVDLERYAGKWYEIARYPNWFQGTDCVATTAEYTLRGDGIVLVVNRCRNGSVDGPVVEARATARRPNADEPGKLLVRFGFFEAPYWIIDLDPDYEWAVVGEPTRSVLWILSRTPTMSDDLYADITSRLPAQDYSESRLIRPPQRIERDE